MWAVLQGLCVTVLLWHIAAAAASPDFELEFEAEPISRLVKISESRAVFRCVASPSTAEIRWLYNGLPIPQNIRWIRVSHHKLTVILSRMDKSLKTSNFLDNPYFQCEIRLKGQVLVSAPAKLVVAALDHFPAQPDVTIAAYVGNIAVIPCDPPNSQPTVVTEFIINGSLVTSSTERLKILPSGDLQILNVTHEDSAEYRCIANNPFLVKKVTSKRKVTLQVQEPVYDKPPTFVKSPRSKIAVALGSNVTLECVASGYPAPKITWRKHHGILPDSRHRQIGGNLFIMSIRRADEGTYHCEAENSAGPKITEKTIVEVQETPQIIKPPRSATVEAGDNITLNCLTRGHPKPSLAWIHNGRPINNGHHHKRNHHLTLENVASRDAGIYQCFATNELGTVYSSALITIMKGNKSANSDSDDYDDVEESHKSHHNKDKNLDYDVIDDKDDFEHEFVKRPHKKKHAKGVRLIPPSKPYVTRLSNTSVMVRWNVPRNDGLPIHFFKVQHKEVSRRNTYWVTSDEDIPAHIHSYAVTNLRTGATYRFQIAAVYSNNDNKSGPISAKFVLLKDPPIEKPPFAPIITYSEAMSPTDITIHWEYQNPNAIPVEGFFIHYRATHTAGKYLKVTVLGANTRSHTISHLFPDTGYDIKMQCFNDAGTSDFSNIFTSKTKPAELPPGAPIPSESDPVEDSDISLTETVSSKNAESNQTLYLILGCVAGALLLAVGCCTILFFRQKNNTDPTCDDSDDEDPEPLRNGYITSNGYVGVRNKLNVNINPLSHLETEDGDKPIELEDMVSNNNEIIRLQTFNLNADIPAEPLLNGPEINESEFNGEVEQSESVIVPYSEESAQET